MQTNPTQRPPLAPPGRSGFTLIELMVVVVIIAAIAGLLLPAIMGAVNRARVADAVSEISQLNSAIAGFEHEYGRTPPSSITLYETGTAWAGDPVSRARIRGIWSRFDFSIDRRLNDDNGDGVINSSDDTNDVFVLKGDQCLVFFLGGMFDSVSGFKGFSSNPVDPFRVDGSQTTRKGPFFEFAPEQIKRRVLGVDYSTTPQPLDANGELFFPVYFDKLPGQTRPLIYASSYSGQGYVEDADGNGATIDGDLDTPATLAENPNGMSVYRQNVKANATDPDPAAFKPKSFQIISPGFDGKYGIGGPYLPDGDVRLPNRVGVPPVFDPNRNVERDNLTNFSGGELVP